MTETRHQRLLIVDFGSQVTQLIARRLREARIYCEIHPFQRVDAAFLAEFQPLAVILSGGPASVTDPDSPRAAPEIFDLGVPVLGICYGQQTMMAQLGGTRRSRPPPPSSAAPSSTPDRDARPSFHGAFPDGPRGGLDEPRRPGHRPRPRLLGDRHLARRPLRDHRRPEPPLLRRAVPPRGAPHRQRRAHPEELHRSRRLHRRLDHGRLPRPGHRGDPRAGRARDG